MSDDLHPHLDQLRASLEAEAAHQRRELEKLARRPLPERVGAGGAWAPLRLLSESPAGRGRTEVVLQAARGSVLHDGIQPGDRVRVGAAGAPDDGPVGRCVGRDERAAEVRLESRGVPRGELAVTRVFDPSTYVRYAEALVRAGARPSHLRDVLLGERGPGEPRSHDLHHVAFDALNPAQHRAVRIALAVAEVALIRLDSATGARLELYRGTPDSPVARLDGDLLLVQDQNAAWQGGATAYAVELLFASGARR